jgi:hypothetical protein
MAQIGAAMSAVRLPPRKSRLSRLSIIQMLSFIELVCADALFSRQGPRRLLIGNAPKIESGQRRMPEAASSW